MFILKLIIVVVIIIAIMTVIEMGLRKVFKIGKRDKTRPRYVNKVHKWGEIGIISAFILSYFIVLSYFLEAYWMNLWVAYFILVIQLFRTFMEWKYQAQQREYIIHLFAACVISLFIVVASYTDWLERLFGF